MNKLFSFLFFTVVTKYNAALSCANLISVESEERIVLSTEYSVKLKNKQSSGKSCKLS